MTWLNIGAGPNRALKPWINTDINPQLHPDFVGDIWDLTPYAGAEKVYMGHVLEHMEYETLPDRLFFLKERIMAEGAELMVVGPDVYKVLDWWKNGKCSMQIVKQTLEDDAHYQGVGEWNEARHHWNCYEERVVRLLDYVGFNNITPMNVADVGDPWPLVSDIGWQCAVLATK